MDQVQAPCPTGISEAYPVDLVHGIFSHLVQKIATPRPKMHWTRSTMLRFAESHFPKVKLRGVPPEWPVGRGGVFYPCSGKVGKPHYTTPEVLLRGVGAV